MKTAFLNRKRRFCFGTAFAIEETSRCWDFNMEASMPKTKSAPAVEGKQPRVSEFDCLVVTNVRVYPFKEGMNMGHIKALARVTLNDQFELTQLRVMDGENGLFVGYPNDPFYKGEEYRSIFFPITRECREHIENCILEKYQQAIAAA